MATATRTGGIEKPAVKAGSTQKFMWACPPFPGCGGAEETTFGFVM